MHRTIPTFAILILLTACGGTDSEPGSDTDERGTTIVGAKVVDGTGAPTVLTNVRFVGDRITEIGEIDPPPADEIVQAAGLVLAPGFIDTHSHADSQILEMPDARAAISQGVTTVVGGADGSSQHPLAEFFAALEQDPPTVNVASYAGHNSYRDQVMAEDFRRPASDEEIASMLDLLDMDMKAGALGLSTGLEYDPGIYSTTDEVVTLAQRAAAYDGRYTSHLRSEDRAFWQAVDEILTIGREAQIPVNITHIKLAMQSSHGQAEQLIARLDAAREQGIEVTADIYPYTYWQSTLEVLFPARDFDNPESARFAVTEVSTPADMLIAEFKPEPGSAGRTLQAIAEARGSDPATTLMDLIREAQSYREETGEASVESVIAVSMAEEDIDRLLRWPWINICTDGEIRGSHPRGFGSFPRILGHYVRERETLTLEQAIHKMTDRAASMVGLPDRGRIEVGGFADLVLFDPLTVSDRASTDQPQKDSVGIHQVWVNGELVWREGEVTEARPGRPLRRPSA